MVIYIGGDHRGFALKEDTSETEILKTVHNADNPITKVVSLDMTTRIRQADGTYLAKQADGSYKPVGDRVFAYPFHF